MNLNELEAMAKNAKGHGQMDILNFAAAADPETILRLIELLKEMGDALKVADGYWYEKRGTHLTVITDTIDKFKELTK